MVRPSRRGGVPVFSRFQSSPKLRSWSPSRLEGASPLRPQLSLCSPMCARPLRNVPVVTTTASLSSDRPSRSCTPKTRLGKPSERVPRPRLARCAGLVPGGKPLSRRRAYCARRTARAVPTRRARGRYEHAELDPDRVGEAAHHSTERVDLANELSLCDAADRGVAGHPPDRRPRPRQKRRAPAHPRRGVRGLDAGVTAADDEDLVLHGRILSQSARGGGRSHCNIKYFALVCPTPCTPARSDASNSSSPP